MNFLLSLNPYIKLKLIELVIKLETNSFEMKCLPNGSMLIIFRANGHCIFFQFNLLIRFQSQSASTMTCTGLCKLPWSISVKGYRASFNYTKISGMIVQKSLLGKKYISTHYIVNYNMSICQISYIAWT